MTKGWVEKERLEPNLAACGAKRRGSPGEQEGAPAQLGAPRARELPRRRAQPLERVFLCRGLWLEAWQGAESIPRSVRLCSRVHFCSCH